MAWSSAKLPVLDAQVEYWDIWTCVIMFRPMTEREIRAAIAAAGLQPEGRRPSRGRGRPRLVWKASDLCELLG